MNNLATNSRATNNPGNCRFFFRSWLVLLALSLLTAQPSGNALAQAEAERPIRIGVLLPPGEGVAGASVSGAMREAVRMGAVMAAEEYSFNAELLGMQLDVLIESADDEEASLELAERLIADEGVFALVGGFSRDEALRLSRLAEANEVLFVNVGAPSDLLRNEACGRYTFHLEPSAAMYLDALAGWYIRSGFRRWFFVYEASEEGEALYRRATWSLRERHFGAREVGRQALTPEEVAAETFTAIRGADPELVVLLLEAEDQLAFLAGYEAAGREVAVAGFPYPATQTRAFFEASRNAAPTAGSGHRASSWEATLDAYGARELNDRFLSRWGEPMDAPAWSAYLAIKTLYEVAFFGGTLDSPELVEFLRSPQTVFDIYKGIGVSFRPWDHQLRQSLYLVRINAEAEDAWTLATLVGELPAIYMPGTDPVERLDQLGDLQRDSRCRF